MSLLQLIIILTGAIFLLFAIDLYQRKKFNLLHFLVFFGGTWLVVLFVLRQDLLNKFGSFFGGARGADVIVYLAVIFLGYMYFEVVNKQTKQQMETTRLNTSFALHEYENDFEKGLYTHALQQKAITDKNDYMFLIRAYNEATMIGSVIEDIIKAGFTKIVVCNDWSSDATKHVVTQLATKNPNCLIVCLSHLINRGPWAANKTLFAFGTKFARTLGVEWLVTYDADGQMDIQDMNMFMQYADHDRFDVVIGSRFVEGAVVENMPWLRRVILLWSRLVTYVFNGIRVTDVPTWYRMYHRDVISKFNITSDWFSYQNDIIGTIAEFKLRFIEIPVHIKYTHYSLTKGQSNTSAVKILKELVYKALFFK